MYDLFKRITTSQYLAALKTLGQSIERCDESTWAAEHIDTAVNQVVFHTLFFADLYLNRSPEGFKEQQFHREHRSLFQDYEEDTDRKPTTFYQKALCEEYLDFCAEKSRSSVAAETRETLSGPSGFTWLRFTRAELHLYNIRHIQHHAAQLGLRHQLLGGEPLSWVVRSD